MTVASDIRAVVDRLPATMAVETNTLLACASRAGIVAGNLRVLAEALDPDAAACCTELADKLEKEP